MMRHVVMFYAILILAGATLWRLVAMVNRWLKRRVLARIERKEHLYFAASAGGSGVPAFHAGGPVRNVTVTLKASTRALQAGLSAGQKAFTAGQIMSNFIADAESEPEPLEETWSNEKVEAWRVINVTVKEGNDGMWMGFPHPDGPTAETVAPVRHPVGVELHAECRAKDHGSINRFVTDIACESVPGENCGSQAGYGCGFYAFKTQKQAARMITNRILFALQPLAVARVLLSGKVIEHEDGYRAEILEVVSVEPVPYPSLRISFEEATAAIMNLAPGWGMSTPIPPPNPFINLGGGS